MDIGWAIFWDCVKKRKVALLLTFVIAVPVLSCAPLSLFLLKRMMGMEIGNAKKFLSMVAAYIILRVIGQGGMVCINRMAQWNALHLSNQMKSNILERLFCIKLSHLKELENGKWLSVFALCSKFTSNLSDVFFGVLHTSIYLLIASLFLSSIGWTMLVWAVVPILLNLLLSYLFSSKIYQSYQKQQAARKSVWEYAAEIVNGMEDIRINGYQDKIEEKHQAVMENSQNARLCTARAEDLRQILSQMTLHVGFIVTLLAAFCIYHQTAVDLVVIYFAVQFVYGAIGGVGSIHSAWQSAKANMQRMSEILNVPVEEEGGQAPDSTCREIFRLEQVEMCRENRILYTNVNFEVTQGDFIMIYGPSGAGKTTLVELMLGIEKPASGCVYGYNVDVEKIDRKQFYQKIAVCPQLPVLLKGDVLTNIAWDEADTSGSDLDDLLGVLLLEKQKTQIIETRGVGVSGGQALRIGIARALYSNREVLILDEPSSALDQTSENKVYELLCKLKGKKTIIVISHRERFRDLADKRIYIGDGQLIVS